MYLLPVMNAKEKEAIAVVKKLRDSGFEAYWAGGAPRDMLLSVPPLDYDIATSARPDEVAGLFKRTVRVGAKFGVVRVIGDEGEYEIATFRSDFSYRDGRHPEVVAFASKEEDVKRRDFTINGILYDPIERKYLDFVGGREDIKRKVIRSIGDPYERFQEDALRLFRAVRFAARFGFAIEPKTFSALKERSEDICRVSVERVFDELCRMLTEGKSRRAFELLDESGLLAVVLPEVGAMKGVPQPPEYHPEGDVWIHTLIMLENLSKGSPLELAWGALLHDVGKPKALVFAPDRIRFDNHDRIGASMAEEVLRRLKAPNALIEAVKELVADHLKFMNIKNMRPAKLKRFLWGENFPLHLELHRLDCLASHNDLEIHKFCLNKLEEFREEQAKSGLKPLVNGDDLISLGFAPGPIFSEIIEAVLDLQLEGTLDSKDAAMKWVAENYPKNPR
ncbi:MAG: HD domain-containing protein [Myxococcota bacterium]